MANMECFYWATSTTIYNPVIRKRFHMILESPVTVRGTRRFPFCRGSPTFFSRLSSPIAFFLLRRSSSPYCRAPPYRHNLLLEPGVTDLPLRRLPVGERSLLPAQQLSRGSGVGTRCCTVPLPPSTDARPQRINRRSRRLASVAAPA
jgi:hypothetical protein